MGKKGKLEERKLLLALCLAAITLFMINAAIAEEDILTIKFHSTGDGKNVSLDLSKYLPLSDSYFHEEAENVLIIIKGSIATIVPRIGWAGDETVIFFVNKSLQEEIEKKQAAEKLKVTNLEPIIEMSFPVTKSFVVSPGEIEFSIVAFDPNNDILTVEWLINGKLVKEEQAQGGVISHFIYNQSIGKRGNLLKNEPFRENVTRYIVNAVVNDSKSSKILEWHFNVVNQSCIDIWQCGNWSECILGKKQRECKQANPLCEYNTYKPPTEWIDPLCMQPELRCEPNWTCSDWQSCKLNYNVRVALSGSITDALQTKQERLCYDASYCIGSVGMESRDCNETITIKTRKVEWCNGNYIEIFNEDTGQFISRIKEYLPGELPHLDIELSLKELSRRDYCWYCYDGQKDYDETGIDCGGSCAECMEIEKTSALFDFLPTLFFIIADILLAGYIFYWIRNR